MTNEPETAYPKPIIGLCTERVWRWHEPIAWYCWQPCGKPQKSGWDTCGGHRVERIY